MKAKRENKVYTITTEQEKQRYLKEGFDIYDDAGELLEHSPLKKIAYSEYAKLMKENQILKQDKEALMKRVAELESEQIVIENENSTVTVQGDVLAEAAQKRTSSKKA